MEFPGTFTRSKSQLRPLPGKQAAYGLNGPGNQAPGRSASMLTRRASRGRYSAEFRLPLYVVLLLLLLQGGSEFGAVAQEFGTQEPISLWSSLPK
jgi:hypothetical protein